MKARIVGVKKHPSNYGGYFCYVFFKTEDGKSFRTCLTPQCGNYSNWRGLKKGDIVDGLVIKNKGLIDADSLIQKV
jgi:hypothetical protein